MSTPIPYPLLNGARQSFVSTEIRFAQPAIGATQGGAALSLNLRGYKAANYGRTRSRAMVYGNHPDPLGKTRGKNEYKAEVEFALAEVKSIQDALQSLAGGAGGYGDVFFTMIITHSENGFDTITDEIRGCTFDSDELSLSEGTEATYQKIQLNPLKVIRNGIDDVTYPLTPIVSS